MGRVRRKSLIIWCLAAAATVSADDVEMMSDGELRESVVRQIFQRVNFDRSRHDLPILRLDAELSALAQKRCEDQLREGTRGHYDTDGYAPYVRYARAGMYDFVGENVAAWSSSTPIPNDAIPEMVRQSHNEMLMELPPDDGHRRAILDPWATSIGIGVAWSGGELRMVQAFGREYLSVEATPAVAEAGTVIPLGGTLGSDIRLRRATVHWEPLPAPLSRFSADTIRTYSYPGEVGRYEPVRVSSLESGSALVAAARYPLDAGRARLKVDGSHFRFTVELAEGPGIYTVVFHASPDGSRAAIPVANVSIIAVDSPGE